MSREIKFRARRKLNGEWVYGSYVKSPSEDWCLIVIDFDDELLESVYVRVITSTVGQFTGLKDKNGKDIYEGDILSSEARIIGHVEGGVRGYCYDVIYANPVGEKRWSLYACITNDYSGNVEVIGNIYQNPELLNP
jgi:uncharacterized phage protein (TIGR01671 family)